MLLVVKSLKANVNSICQTQHTLNCNKLFYKYKLICDFGEMYLVNMYFGNWIHMEVRLIHYFVKKYYVIISKSDKAAEQEEVGIKQTIHDILLVYIINF